MRLDCVRTSHDFAGICEFNGACCTWKLKISNCTESFISISLYLGSRTPYLPEECVIKF